jgi:hypothetical protein
VAVLGRSRALCGRSEAEKCEEHGCLENVLISRVGARSAATGVVFGRACGLCSRSWAALSTYVVGLGSLLGPMFSILGSLFSQERPKNEPGASQEYRTLENWPWSDQGAVFQRPGRHGIPNDPNRRGPGTPSLGIDRYIKF